MCLKDFCQGSVRYCNQKRNQLKLNTIQILSFAKFFPVAKGDGESEGGEHQSVHQLIRTKPFPECSDFGKIRPRQTAEYHDDDTAQ